MKWFTAVNGALCHVCCLLFCFIFSLGKLQRSGKAKRGEKKHIFLSAKRQDTREKTDCKCQIHVFFFRSRIIIDLLSHCDPIVISVRMGKFSLNRVFPPSPSPLSPRAAYREVRAETQSSGDQSALCDVTRSFSIDSHCGRLGWPPSRRVEASAKGVGRERKKRLTGTETTCISDERMIFYLKRETQKMK